jgi:hypothetical protein
METCYPWFAHFLRQFLKFALPICIGFQTANHHIWAGIGIASATKLGYPLPGCQEWGKMTWSPPYLGGIVGNLLKNKRTVGC